MRELRESTGKLEAADNYYRNCMAEDGAILPRAIAKLISLM
jgi:hypothetical protein